MTCSIGSCAPLSAQVLRGPGPDMWSGGMPPSCRPDMREAALPANRWRAAPGVKLRSRRDSGGRHPETHAREQLTRTGVLVLPDRGHGERRQLRPGTADLHHPLLGRDRFGARAWVQTVRREVVANLLEAERDRG